MAISTKRRRNRRKTRRGGDLGTGAIVGIVLGGIAAVGILAMMAQGDPTKIDTTNQQDNQQQV